MITTKQFNELVPLLASSDVTRPYLQQAFWYDNHALVTDGRIALAVEHEQDDLPVIDGQYAAGSSLLRDTMPKIEKLIAAGVYLPFDCGEKTYSAASAALGDLIWDMDFLTSPVDDDYPDEVNTPRDVNQAFSAVVLDCPPRPIVSAYYAAIMARLVLNYGPAVAYSGAADPHGTLYVKGDNWRLFLMPRLVERTKNAATLDDMEYRYDLDIYDGLAVSDAATGQLIHRRGAPAITCDDIRFPKEGAK